MANLSPSEFSRLQKMLFWENQLKGKGFVCIAGVDEAGRGPLAGPVVAAACFLPEGALFEHLNDSKKLTPIQRERLYSEICSFPSLDWGVGVVDAQTIDQINILQATFLAMKKAVSYLKTLPDYLLIDGSQVPHFQIPAQGIIKGDSLSCSIAAASVLAKVTRDRMMEEFDLRWPGYGFKKHKGYGTKEHLAHLREMGPSPIHRLTFEPLKGMLCSLV
jgi:ribonuclease HII